jgi:transcriptional regulator with XRE-family HTH domain
MSQERLAAVAGLNYKYIGRIELGKANAGSDVLVRLAGALRVPVGELFETITPSGVKAPSLPLDDVDRVTEALRALTAAIERLLSHEPRPPAARAPRGRRSR